MRTGRRFIVVIVGAPEFLRVTAGAALAYPQPLFTYHVERGSPQLWTCSSFTSTPSAV